MSDVPATEIVGKKTLVVPQNTVEGENDSVSEEDYESGAWKSRDVLHHQVSDLREELSGLRARLDAYDGRNTFEQLYTQMQRVINDRVNNELTRQIFPYIHSQNRIDSETNLRLEDMRKEQCEVTKVFKSVNMLIRKLESDVSQLKTINEERQAYKARPFYKRYNPLGADADAAALPALLAQLQTRSS